MNLKIIALFFLLIPLKEKLPKEFSAKVIGVKDGDTIEVLYKKKPIIIRLEHIDTPEKKQAYGTKAKQFVSDKIYSKKVRIINKGRWHWDRLIAEVYYKKENINKALVNSGLAMHFKQYSKNKEYDQLEKQAKENSVGMWSLPNVIAPWDFRKQKSNKKTKTKAGN